MHVQRTLPLLFLLSFFLFFLLPFSLNTSSSSSLVPWVLRSECVTYYKHNFQKVFSFTISYANMKTCFSRCTGWQQRLNRTANRTQRLIMKPSCRTIFLLSQFFNISYSLFLGCLICHFRDALCTWCVSE